MSVAVRRPTKQRAAIEALLVDIGDFMSAQDLHARLRSQGQGVGLATVYRTLQAMADDGDVDMMRSHDGEAVYRRCSSGHHHHLVCRACGRTVEVEGPAVETWTDKISAENGFTDVQHTLEIFGLCATCQVPRP
ncbi:MAG: Fur family transcriptional regulator, ferric uptake regulator [Actinomycetota bacterium]|jgi:Fur family ferric uptake transcriptional regulator|nr:Fur family transcriptional regulator, ferric uptake regulator [Actinomycetota bacterium]